MLIENNLCHVFSEVPCVLYLSGYTIAWYPDSAFVGALSVWTQDESQLQRLPKIEFCTLGFFSHLKSPKYLAICWSVLH